MQLCFSFYIPFIYVFGCSFSRCTRFPHSCDGRFLSITNARFLNFTLLSFLCNWFFCYTASFFSSIWISLWNLAILCIIVTLCHIILNFRYCGMWTQTVNTAADTVNKTLLQLSEQLYCDGTGKNSPCACQEVKWGSGGIVLLIWDFDDFSISHPGHFNTGTHQIGCWVGPRVRNNTFEKRKILLGQHSVQTTGHKTIPVGVRCSWAWCGRLLAI